MDKQFSMENENFLKYNFVIFEGAEAAKSQIGCALALANFSFCKSSGPMEACLKPLVGFHTRFDTSVNS